MLPGPSPYSPFGKLLMSQNTCFIWIIFFSLLLGKMHKLHSGEIRWNLCPLQPTTEAAAARQCSSQQRSEESSSSCVSAAPFQAATSWTTPISSPSWTSSFTATPATHGLGCSKTLIDKTCLFAKHGIFIEYWFTVKDIRICCWSAKKKEERKKKTTCQVSILVYEYIYSTSAE